MCVTTGNFSCGAGESISPARYGYRLSPASRIASLRACAPPALLMPLRLAFDALCRGERHSLIPLRARQDPMRDEQHRRLRLEQAHCLRELLRRFVIQVVRRLVEDRHLGPLEQCSGDGGALLLPAGQANAMRAGFALALCGSCSMVSWFSANLQACITSWKLACGSARARFS